MTPFDKKRKFLTVLASKQKPKKEMKSLSVPENLFIKCNECGAMISKEDVIKNLNVCTNCGYHFPLSAYNRVLTIIDCGTFKELNVNLKTFNPLDFPNYSEKLQEVREKTKLNESVITGYGLINGIKAVICIMDTRFLMGSMGLACGEKITRAVEFATKQNLPLIIFSASGGARMQEGILSLYQMAKTSAAIRRHSDSGGLFISVLTNPTTGGVTASFASLGDIIIAEPNALIGFAGPRVIENTIGKELPKEAQKSEFLLKNGFVDIIAKRNDIKLLLTNILNIHQK